MGFPISSKVIVILVILTIAFGWVDGQFGGRKKGGKKGGKSSGSDTGAPGGKKYPEACKDLPVTGLARNWIKLISV